MEVYFHIGLQKTGTTFLQRELFSKFEATDLEYIDGHFFPEVFNPIRFQDPIYFDADAIRKELITLAKGKNKLLVSFEDLSGHPYNAAQSRSVIIDKIKKCFPQAKIIFFLRRQDAFAVSSYLQTVNGGNKFSLKEYYETVFKNNQHDRYICPTLDYFQFSKYVDYLIGQFGTENCFIIPYEMFVAQNELTIKRLFNFLDVDFQYTPSTKEQNKQKGVIFTNLLRFENYFVPRRISANSSFYSGIPIYNFRKKKKFYITLKYIMKFLLKKGLFPDFKYKDRSGTGKRILELCKEDNRTMDLNHSLGLADYGYY